MSAIFTLKRAAAHAALVAPFVLLLACGDDDGPATVARELPLRSATLDTAIARLSAVRSQPVLGAFSSNASIGDFALFTDDLPDPFVPGVMSSVGMPTGLRAQLGLQQQIPDSLRGNTYSRSSTPDVLDASWVLDTLADGAPRPGAPANGVRFRLRAVHFGGSGLDTSLVGWADLIEPSAGTLELRVFDLAGTPVLEVHGTPGAFVEGVVSEGWAQRGARRLSQRTTISGTSSSFVVTTEWDVSAAGIGARRVITFTLDPITHSLTTLTLTIDEHEYLLRIDRGTSLESITLRVLVDGTSFAEHASIFSDVDADWRAARGGSVTPAERALLDKLLRVAILLPDPESALHEAAFWLFRLRAVP